MSTSSDAHNALTLPPAHVYEAGDKVFVHSLKRLATVLNIYGDGQHGAHGDMRLDVSGNTPVTDFEPYDAVKHAEFDLTFEPIKEEWKVAYGITKDIPYRKAPQNVEYAPLLARTCVLCDRPAQCISRETFGREDKPFQHIKTCFCGGYVANSYAAGLGDAPEEAEKAAAARWDSLYFSQNDKYWFQAGAWSVHGILQKFLTVEQLKQVQALMVESIPEYLKLQADAELGRVAIKFVDRAGDIDPVHDPAERICTQFHEAMCEVLDARLSSDRARLLPEDVAPGATGGPKVAFGEWKKDAPGEARRPRGPRGR